MSLMVCNHCRLLHRFIILPDSYRLSLSVCCCCCCIILMQPTSWRLTCAAQ